MTVGLIQHGSRARPIIPSSQFKLNYVYDANWISSAPASYVNALAQATTILVNAFPNTNVTINIEVGYGYLEQNEIGTAVPVSPSSSVGSDFSNRFVSYGTIRSQLAAIPNPTASLTALLNNTPAGGTLNGQTNFSVCRAGMKVLNIMGVSGGPTDPNDGGLDGAIGMGSGWSNNELVGVFLHELTHAMGREAGIAPFNFSRFTSVGVRDFSSNTAAYFSLDGGTTRVADYDNSNDVSDFLNGGVQDGSTGGSWQSFPSDSFDAFQSGNAIQNLTTADTKLMNAMGFQ